MTSLLSALVCAAALTASPLSASVLWSESFDRLPSGPLAPGLFNSTIILDGCAATVSPVASGGQALLLQDNSATGRVLVERNFVADPTVNEGAVHLTFTVRKHPSRASADTAAFLVALGAFSPATSSHLVVNGGQNRTLDVRFLADGRLVVANGAKALSSPATQLLRYPPEGLAVNIYANAGQDEVEIPVGPDGTLHTVSPGRFTVWLGQSRVVLAGVSEFAFYNPNNTGFGRVGFFTGNAHSEHGLEFSIDNIAVSSVPASGR